MKVKKNTQSYKTITSNTREQGRGTMKNCWVPSSGSLRSAWLCSDYSFLHRREYKFYLGGLRWYDATTEYKVGKNLCFLEKWEII